MTDPNAPEEPNGVAAPETAATPSARLVVDTKTPPCGCIVEVFSDRTTQTVPCDSHGLMEVANRLGQAAQMIGGAAEALAATANARLQREAQRSALKVVRGILPQNGVPR